MAGNGSSAKFTVTLSVSSFFILAYLYNARARQRHAHTEITARSLPVYSLEQEAYRGKTGSRTPRQFTFPLLICYELRDISITSQIGRKRRAKHHVVSLFARNRALCCPELSVLCVREEQLVSVFCKLVFVFFLLSQFDGLAAWMSPQPPRRLPGRW